MPVSAGKITISIMPEGPYYTGQTVAVWARLTSQDVLTDPGTEISIMNRDPSGNEATEVYNAGAGNVAKDSTGVYYYNLALDEDGDWYVRVKTTGSNAAANEKRLHVLDTNYDSP